MGAIGSISCPKQTIPMRRARDERLYGLYRPYRRAFGVIFLGGQILSLKFEKRAKRGKREKCETLVGAGRGVAHERFE
jgi:hypothetical protein